MEVKQNAVLNVVKGDNVHAYHVPPAASVSECYDVLREMLAYVFERLKADFEAQAKAAAAPVESSDLVESVEPKVE